MEALWDGFAVPERNDALAVADIVISATAARDILTARDLAVLPDGAILINVGHLPMEIDVAGMAADLSVKSFGPTEAGISTFELLDRGGGSTSSPTATWSTSPARAPWATRSSRWTSGSRSRRVASRRWRRARSGAESCVVPVPRRIDEWVAATYVEQSRARVATAARSEAT